MLQRIIDRWRQKEYRHYFWLVLGAKIAGVLLCLAIIKGFTWFLFTPALADDAAAAPPPAYVNPINTMWTVIAAFLVFFMQAGFMFLEAGFARTRETVNVILEGIVDTCLCGLLFYAWGFAFMFGHGNGFIGYHWFFLQGVPDTYEGTGVAFLAFWLFQYAFADTCSTITSGAMVGRTGFVGDLLYSVGVSGFIYPIIGHWAWGPDGWLTTITPVAVPRLRRVHGRSHDRRLRLSRGRHRPRPPHRSQVQARRRRPDARPRHDHRGRRRRHPLVRMVRVQSRQHAFRDGRRWLRSRRGEHDAGRLRRRPERDVLAVPPKQGMGLRHHGERLPRRSRRDHLPLLLGVAYRRHHPRCRCRRRLRLRRRPDGMAAHRRSRRRMAGPRCLRNLGNVEPRAACLRQIRRLWAHRCGRLGAASQACSTAAARRSSSRSSSAAPPSRPRRSAYRWSCFTRSR